MNTKKHLFDKTTFNRTLIWCSIFLCAGQKPCKSQLHFACQMSRNENTKSKSLAKPKAPSKCSNSIKRTFTNLAKISGQKSQRHGSPRSIRRVLNNKKSNRIHSKLARHLLLLIFLIRLERGGLVGIERPWAPRAFGSKNNARQTTANKRVQQCNGQGEQNFCLQQRFP